VDCLLNGVEPSNQHQPTRKQSSFKLQTNRITTVTNCILLLII
jgi:hypothetical protein